MTRGHDPKLVARYILWLARQSEDPFVTPMQLLKLVYVCHGWMLGLHGRPLINESVEAWQYGPVVPSVYRAYRRYGGSAIGEPDIPTTEPDGFSEIEKAVMSKVWTGYGKYTGVQLSSMTHRAGTPWAITKTASGKNSIISDDLIEDFYRRLAEEQAARQQNAGAGNG